MLRDVYVVNSETSYFWFPKKEDADNFISQLLKDGDVDIRYTYSTCEIDENNKDIFHEIEVLEVYVD